MAFSSSQYIETCAASSMLLLALVVQMFSHATGDSAEEKQKCVEQLEGMATCLPYLGGYAKASTPDCCSGFKQAIKSVNRCVCLVVKDCKDPDLGSKINISLVLRLPDACKAPVYFSQCPGMIPNSMSTLNTLSNLTLSYNNLSGPVPRGNQFSTLNDPFSYVGNRYLCGLPPPNKCPGDYPDQAPGSNDSEDENDSEKVFLLCCN